MNLFYSYNANDSFFNLSSEESFHCVKVLRKKIGDIICVTNGKGLLIEAKLEDENIKGVALSCFKILKNSKSPISNIHIAISPLKNSQRYEWFVEKATELSIAEITPIISKNSEKVKVNMERLNKICIEAMKQSKHEFLPIINEPIDFKSFVLNNNNQNDKFIAYCGEEEKISINYADLNNSIVLIGPEGDFTNEEIKFALNNNFKTLSLGDYRLRTETAGVFVVSSMCFNLLKNS